METSGRSTLATGSRSELEPLTTLPPLHEATRAETRDAARPTTRRKAWLGFLLGIGFGAILIGIFALLRDTSILRAFETSPGALGQLTRALEIVFAFFLAVCVHECGHALAGRLVGFRLYVLMAGPLILRRTSAGWTLRVKMRMTVGGFAYCAPVRWTGVEHYRRSVRAMVAGGPLLSAVAFVVGIAVLAVAVPHAPTPVPFWASLVMLVSLMALSLAVFPLWPERTKAGVFTDGAQLHRWRPVKDADLRERPWIPVTAAIGLGFSQRPREWNSELVRLLETATTDVELGPSACVYLAHRALDVGDVTAAAEWLQRAIELRRVRSDARSDLATGALAFQAAIFEAAWRHDLAAARRWRDIAGPTAKTHKWLSALADAAMARIEGKDRELAVALEHMHTAERESLISHPALIFRATLDRLGLLATTSSR